MFGPGKYPVFLKAPLTFADGGLLGAQFSIRCLLLPVVLLGFALGVFQSMTSDFALKWYGHTIGVISVVLGYVVYRTLGA